MSFPPPQGVVKDIVHESGRGAPVAKVQFKNAYRFKRDNETFVAVEGLYTGQFIFAGKKGKYVRCARRIERIESGGLHHQPRHPSTSAAVVGTSVGGR